MPKPATYPHILDNALQINISKLKKWGYLNTGQINKTTLTWSSKGQKIGSILLIINTSCAQPYIELDYKYCDTPRNYRVNLITKPSNLGKGVLWFFVCPNTGRHCRILYSINGYFLHRAAFTGCMYDSQTQSKKYRDMGKLYGAYFKTDRLYEQLYKKHFKKRYAGKPTKKYAKLISEIRKAERVSVNDIERLLSV